MPYRTPEREKHRRKHLRLKKVKADPEYYAKRMRVYRAKKKAEMLQENNNV